jgi:hypothetical protein
MEYKQALALVQSVIDTVTNTAAAVIVALKDFGSKNIFKVNVTNPVTKMDVEGRVEVTNTKEIENQLKNNALAIRELKKPIESEKKVRVSNFSDIKFPKFPRFEFPKTFSVSNFPKDIRVSNLKDLVPALKKMADNIEKMDVRPEVRVEAPVVNVEPPVVNIPKQDPPVVNVEAPDLSELTKILEFFNSLGAKKPLPVRLSDGQKFYKALERMAEIYAGSSFSAFRDVSGNDGRGILNKNNELLVTTSDTWSLNEVDTQQNGNLTYLGEETIDGRWRITRVQRVGQYNTMNYATIKNNPSAAEYDFPTAWTNHETLDYGRVSEAL